MLTPSSTRKAESEGSLLLRSSISGLPALRGQSAVWPCSWGWMWALGRQARLRSCGVVSGQMSRELRQSPCVCLDTCVLDVVLVVLDELNVVPAQSPCSLWVMLAQGGVKAHARQLPGWVHS